MSFTQREARTLVRKAVAHVPEGESIRHLNIMPMMDMMTILLVAFIFQMATSDLELTASVVQLPKTEADAPLPEKSWMLVITQNGVAKAVIQDVVSCDAMQQTMALLKTLALGNCQIEAGRVMPVKEAIRRIRRGAA